MRFIWFNKDGFSLVKLSKILWFSCKFWIPFKIFSNINFLHCSLVLSVFFVFSSSVKLFSTFIVDWEVFCFTSNNFWEFFGGGASEIIGIWLFSLLIERNLSIFIGVFSFLIVNEGFFSFFYYY